MRLRRQALSTIGAESAGNTTFGSIVTAANTPESQVEPVLSNTTRLRAKLTAVPPIAEMIVPSVIMEKSLVQSPGFLACMENQLLRLQYKRSAKEFQ